MSYAEVENYDKKVGIFLNHFSTTAILLIKIQGYTLKLRALDLPKVWSIVFQTKDVIFNVI